MYKRQVEKGLKVLYFCNDMDVGELRPYIYAYGMGDKLDQILLVDFDGDVPREAASVVQVIEGTLDHWGTYPDLIVFDGFLEIIGWFANYFMPMSDKGIQQEFNADLQMHWCHAFKYLTPFLKKRNCGLFGVAHSPKQGHNLPHSTKLLGYLHQVWLLYKYGDNLIGFPDPNLKGKFEKLGHATRMLWNIKNRGGADPRHVVYRFGPTSLATDAEKAEDPYQPSTINTWLTDDMLDEDDEDMVTEHDVMQLVQPYWQSMKEVITKLSGPGRTREQSANECVNALISDNKIEMREYRRGRLQIRVHPDTLS